MTPPTLVRTVSQEKSTGQQVKVQVRGCVREKQKRLAVLVPAALKESLQNLGQLSLPAMTATTMKPTAAVEASPTVEPFSTAEAAVKSAATTKPFTAMESTAAAESFMVKSAASKTVMIPATSAEAAITPAATVETSAIPARMAPIPVVPRTHANEYAVHKIIGPVVAVGRAGVRVIIIVAVGTNRRRAISWPVIAGPHAHAKIHSLGARKGSAKEANAE